MTWTKINYAYSIKKMAEAISNSNNINAHPIVKKTKPKETALIVLVTKPTKGKKAPAKKKVVPKSKVKKSKAKPKAKKVVKKVISKTKPKVKTVSKKKVIKVKPKAKKIVKKAVSKAKPKSKIVVKKKATKIKPIARKTVTKSKPKEKEVTKKKVVSVKAKAKVVKKTITLSKQKSKPVVALKPIKPYMGEEKITDLKSKIAPETFVDLPVDAQGEDLHILPEHDGITHPITKFEAHKKESIFHSKEEVSLHQFNQKINNAKPSKKTMNIFNRKRGG